MTTANRPSLAERIADIDAQILDYQQFSDQDYAETKIADLRVRRAGLVAMQESAAAFARERAIQGMKAGAAELWAHVTAGQPAA